MNITWCLHGGIARRSAQYLSALGLVLAAAASPAVGQPNVLGRWIDPPGPFGPDWPLLALHAIHLPTGKILVFSGSSNARLWDPVVGDFTPVPTTFELNCSGHAALANGSILVAGGGAEGPELGTDETKIFNLRGTPWEQVGDMNFARWYPTCTTLPDGKVLAVSGKDGDGIKVEELEIYDPDTQTWDQMQQSADKLLALYPFMFVLPDGTVFYAGGGVGLNTFTLDLEFHDWSPAIPSPFGGRRGAAVTYEPGKVLKSGGEGADESEIIPDTAIIDFDEPMPQWELLDVAPMIHARRHHNLVMLPDGKILAVGGEKFVAGPGGPVLEAVVDAEWFDPNEPLPQWDILAFSQYPHARHSTAVLRADAKVLVAGGEGFPPFFTEAEIFEPPYLFDANGGDAPRPLIGFAPTVITYGLPFKVILSSGSPVEADEIEKVSLVRVAAVTHWFDQNQRYVRLTFTVIDDHSVEANAPANANLAPPGYYMLFLISDDGVPSVAAYVQLIPPPSP